MPVTWPAALRRAGPALFRNVVSAADLKLPDLTAFAREDVGRALVTHFLDMWGENEVLTALLRLGVTNQAGAERMQTIFRDQLLPVARAACPDPEQMPARAALCAGRLLGLALTRQEAVAWLAPTVQRYLTAPHP